MLDNGLSGRRLWRVGVPITNSQAEDLVTPQTYHAGPPNIGNMTYNGRGNIILTGFAFNFEAAGAVTLSLVSHENPWIAEGQLIDDSIYEFAVTDAGYYRQSISDCCIALAPTDRRPDASPTTSQGAKLKLATSASQITGGFFMAWGYYSTEVASLELQTSSPVTY